MAVAETIRETPEPERTAQFREFREIPESPPPALRYRRGLHLIRAMRELWVSRHTMWNLGVREIRVQYNQAILGLAWAVLTPVVQMIVFSVFLYGAAGLKVNTHGIPYPIFVYTGLLAWGFFSSACTSAGQVLVSNPLLNKVYAPREVFPLGTIGTSAFNSAISTAVLGVLMVMYQVWPQPETVWVPLLILILVGFTIGVGLILAALTVYLRDLRQALPLLLQVGLFVSSVLVGIDVIPVQWRGLYVFLDPPAMVIDALRQTVLYGHPPNMTYLGLSSLSTVIVLVGGYLLFKQLETGFADVS
jgi:ABC-2 type transport system permease protein/lipopolysaccharide transport system permease protein